MPWQLTCGLLSLGFVALTAAGAWAAHVLADDARRIASALLARRRARR